MSILEQAWQAGHYLEEVATQARVAQATELGLGPWACEVCDFTSRDPVAFNRHLGEEQHDSSEGHLGAEYMLEQEALAFTEARVEAPTARWSDELELAQYWFHAGWKAR